MRKLFKRTRKAIMRHLIHFFLLIAAICATGSIYTSCSEENDCSMTGRPMMNCSFYTIVPDTRTVRRDTLDSLTITAYGTDSVIVNNQKEVKDLTLPLRYTEDSTVLIFRYNEKQTDTVVFRHTNTPYFLSMDCGYQMQQSVTSCTYSRHVLDSIYISNPEASIYGTENIKLFY